MAKTRVDGQLTGMAGEFLTVGKLFKRGLQASVTFGNAKGIDVLVFNPSNNKSYVVQVKTLRQKNCFPMRKENIIKNHIYIFIILYAFEKQEEYFIVPGSDLLNNINGFYGSSYKFQDKPSSMPAINYGPLKPYKDNWSIFDH